MDGKKKLYDGFGEMMFTHFGVTGPLILSASSYTAKTARKKKELSMFIDLKPALSKNNWITESCVILRKQKTDSLKTHWADFSRQN